MDKKGMIKTIMELKRIIDNINDRYNNSSKYYKYL